MLITVLLILLALTLPPVAAFLMVGFGVHFWLNILLTLLFVVPGEIHAIYLVVTHHGGGKV
ncbi:MAG: YqaE/Pmp3 family membrane protein [Phycisphaeraceae bacterium]